MACESCNDLRKNSSTFVQNGVTTAVCNSLKNDTGFSTGNSHNDCTDLELANDCLIGDMAEEVEIYDVCEWQKYMQKFASNVYTMFAAIICAVCGLWTNLHALANRVTALENWKETIDTWKVQINAWKTATQNWINNDAATKNYVTSQINNNNTQFNTKFNTIKCYLQHMNENTGGVIHAYVDDDPSKPALNGFRVAGGITIRSGASAAPMSISVIGSTARITGSIQCDGNMPSSYRSGGSSSAVSWLDFFNGGTEIETTSGNKSYHGNTPRGNLFLYEYKVNPCSFGFKDLYNANLFAGDAGDIQCRVHTYKKGDTFPYDYGWGPNGEGDGQVWNDDRLLIQVRLVNVRTWGITRNNGRISPNGITMAVPCPSEWDCGNL